MSDDWFAHDGEARPQAEHGEKVSTRALGITFLSITFGVTFLILILVAFYGQFNKNTLAERREGIDFVAGEYLDYKRNMRETLGRTEWVNRAEGVVRVPLDTAKDSVIAAYAEGERAGLPAWNGPSTARLSPDQGDDRYDPTPLADGEAETARDKTAEETAGPIAATD